MNIRRVSPYRGRAKTLARHFRNKVDMETLEDLFNMQEDGLGVILGVIDAVFSVVY
jgi:hypothetical protein